MRKSRFLIPAALFSLVLIAASPDRVHEGVRELASEASDGNPRALYNLARLHDIGYDTIEVDTARSTALYRKSAMAGYGPAQNFLGFRYFRGEGVRKDMDSALYWLRKAAEGGDPGAANNLGFLYISGEGIEKDFMKAREWFEKGAEGELATAQTQLADMYRDGVGGETDSVGALRLYRRAAEKGFLPAKEKAALLLKTMADNGDAQAMAILAEAYAKGDGVAYDHNLANEYFLRAALLGDPSAAFIIAELLEIFPDLLSDKGLEKIIRESLRVDDIPETIFSPSYWYEKAAEGNVMDADAALSRLKPL